MDISNEVNAIDQLDRRIADLEREFVRLTLAAGGAADAVTVLRIVAELEAADAEIWTERERNACRVGDDDPAVAA